MGTRALISIDGKPMIATHWDGYPESLGKDLLKCERCLPKVIEVAKKHIIDFAETSIREELNNERVKILSEQHNLTEEEIRNGMRSSGIISASDHEIGDISYYRDWAEYEYNIVGKKVYFRSLRDSYPTSVRNAGGFTELT